MNFLRLVRVNNLIIILITEIIVNYCLIVYFLSINNLAYRMDNVVFLLISVSSILIAAGANIHNDIQDKEIDAISKPNKPIPSGAISLKTARILLFISNFLGVILTFAAAYLIGEPMVAIFQFTILAILYAYSMSLKCTKLIGNIIVSASIAMVPVLIWIYIIYDNAAHGLMFNYNLRWMHFSIFFLSVFAFISTLIREIIKDREDMKGDLDCGCRTWASEISPKTFKFSIIILSIILVIIILLYQIYLPDLLFYKISFLLPQILIILILIPWVYKATERTDFKNISNFMKLIILSGLVLPIMLSL